MAQVQAHPVLAMLDPDPEQAAQKYRSLRSKLVFYFRHNGCADAENLADEVFSRVLRRLSEGAEAYSGLNAYCYGIADYVLKEERRRKKTEELPDDLVERQSSRAELIDSENAILVRQILGHLPQDERDLFTRYYLGDRNELARTTKTTPNSLRIRVFRIRQRLQKMIGDSVQR